MWVIKNIVTDQFFAGWTDDNWIETTDSKVYAAHFSTWDKAAEDLRLLTINWKALPKDEA